MSRTVATPHPLRFRQPQHLACDLCGAGYTFVAGKGRHAPRFCSGSCANRAAAIGLRGARLHEVLKAVHP